MKIKAVPYQRMCKTMKKNAGIMRSSLPKDHRRWQTFSDGIKFLIKKNMPKIHLKNKLKKIKIKS